MLLALACLFGLDLVRQQGDELSVYPLGPLVPAPQSGAGQARVLDFEVLGFVKSRDPSATVLGAQLVVLLGLRVLCFQGLHLWRRGSRCGGFDCGETALVELDRARRCSGPGLDLADGLHDGFQEDNVHGLLGDGPARAFEELWRD